MESSETGVARLRSRLTRIAPELPSAEAAIGYLLPFALVVYLSLKGGGYDTLVRGEVGLLAWWLILLGAIAGLLSGRSLPKPARIALVLLGLFATWTTLSALWAQSAERSVEEGARVLTYLGVFALAVLAQGPGGLRRTAAAVGSAVAVVGVLALLSRLQPSWFPPNEVAEFIPETASRISYPLGYWNGVAALIALGVPVLAWLATGSRSIPGRAAAAAALPPLLLAVYLTLSRGGVVDLAVGAGVLLALHPRRLQLLPTFAIAGVGGLLLIGLASSRDALEAGLLDSTAASQGDEMLALTILISALVAAAQAGLALGAHSGRWRWPSVPRQTAARIAGGCAAVLLIAIVVTGAPGRAADSFDDFKQQVDPGDSSTRFESASGNGRWQYWSAAADAGSDDPILGIGAGNYEFYWAQNPGLPGTVRDAHSLYVETFGELGVPGLLLLGSVVLWVLGFGLRRTLLATGSRRGVLAALLASAAAFAVGAGIDWLWELAVLPIIFLLVAAALLAGDLGPGAAEGRRWRARWTAPAALVALVVIASPLLGASAIQASRTAFTSGDLDTALSRAEAAQRWQPYAGTPRLQQALVFEAQGRLPRAATEAQAAIDKEPTNWRPWFILARVEAQRSEFQDRTEEALDAFRQVRVLNRNSVLFGDSEEG